MLAVGDGMASLVGQGLGGPRLPWNASKGWAGFLAFVFFGTLAAAVLSAWTARLPLDPFAWHAGRTLGVAFVVTLGCALVESLPSTMDDNLTVPLAGALLFPLVAQADPQLLVVDPDLGRRFLAGLLVNGLIALAAWRARSIDRPGALAAVAIGTAITVGLGLPALALMIAFFVLGSAATRLGYRTKAALANGGVPALLASLAGLTPSPLRDLLVVAYAGAVATAAADTCSSEIGKAYGRSTFLITSLRPVPPGTEGAISLEGTLGGLAGAAVVAAVGAALGVYSWPLAVLVSVAGLLGSLAESVIGTVAERRGWLDNNLLNALNTAIGAGVAVLLVDASAGLGR